MIIAWMHKKNKYKIAWNIDHQNHQNQYSHLPLMMIENNLKRE